MSKWNKHQPRDGDLILVCGHEGAAHYHWYILDMDEHGEPQPLPFKRPDGSVGEAKGLELNVCPWNLSAENRIK